MSDELIWIVTDQEPSTAADGARGGQRTSNPFDGSFGESPKRRGVPVKVQQLEQGITEFLTAIGTVLSCAKQRANKMSGVELEEIELSVEVNGEGQLSLLGTGSKVGGKGAMTLKFKVAKTPFCEITEDNQ